MNRRSTPMADGQLTRRNALTADHVSISGGGASQKPPQRDRQRTHDSAEFRQAVSYRWQGIIYDHGDGFMFHNYTKVSLGDKGLRRANKNMF